MGVLLADGSVGRPLPVRWCCCCWGLYCKMWLHFVFFNGFNIWICAFFHITDVLNMDQLPLAFLDGGR